MKKHFYLFLTLLSVSLLLLSSNCKLKEKNTPSDNNNNNNEKLITDTKPKIQVVFLLDATGSMSGLIGTAKEKIWSITSSFSQTDPAPEIEVGIIFYRDRGDEFITQVVPLSTDLDNLYEKLMVMQAAGGGDAPENVNQALYEAVTDIQWDNNPNTYKTIFLVGDYPPHMDYQDDVKYPKSCSIAKEKEIIVNTILMGNDREAGRIWQEIATATGGEFIKTDMNVNNVSVRTPYDDQISKSQYELDQTRVYYGTSKEETNKKSMQSNKMMQGDAAVNARRSEYNMSKAGRGSYYGTNELINDVSSGKKISDIKKSDLPENLQEMSSEEIQEYVDTQIKKRKELEKEIANLNKKRQEHIDLELEKMNEDVVEKSFDNVVFDAVKTQAQTKNIQIEGKAKR